MSQQASVTLNTVIYTPAGVNSGVATWINRTSSYVNGYKTLTQRYKDPSNGATQTKIDFALSIPVVATAETAQYYQGELIRVNSVQMSFWTNTGSPAAEKTDLRLSAKDLLLAQVAIDAIDNSNPAFG
jgi:hypothetical protein